MSCELRLEIDAGGKTIAAAVLAMNFLPPVILTQPGYIPEPAPVQSPVLIGAHHCPLWEADKPHMWDNLLKHPERTPALGFYNQENPEVSDWETLWAVEHGISFFMASETRLHALRENIDDPLRLALLFLLLLVLAPLVDLLDHLFGL